MTTDEACDVVDLLFASYPTQRQRMTAADAKAMTLAYASALADLDATIARTAVSALVLTEEWMPTIAAIRAKAAELTAGRKRHGGDAWGDVLQAMRRYGSHRTPGVDFQFDDPLVARCVKRLGWIDLCASENQVADRAHFMRLYDGLAGEAASDRAVAGALPGITAKELPSGVRSLSEAIKALAPGGSS